MGQSTRNVLIGMGAVAGLVVVATLFPAKERETGPDLPAATGPYGNCLLRGLGNESQSLAALVTETLRNPASFEHVQTVPGPVKDGTFTVAMTYRATNGFGAVDTATALGEVRVSDCAARVISTE